eukprot:CAMPEP_0176445682 /NCGR_PEP_ID=MMETSP0127-20121128/23858_1 /TAXON_ID=938130 /ORGANISM="Platyophrya macrostoma, Strain WH" /LENGTH=455 /DNA_ID=CAMNT_0017831537 /DNA_START=126 /DNA_END=1493 /DNA_ORIENTATION=+
MGLKSTANPGPLSLEHQTNTAEATPSVTPMRPTPLVGNWCDLPWGGEDVSPAHTPHAGKALHPDGMDFLVAHPAPTLMQPTCSTKTMSDPMASILAPRSDTTSSDLMQRDNTVVPDESSTDSASSDGELLQDLYLATPGVSMLPDDFDVEDHQHNQQQVSSSAAAGSSPAPQTLTPPFEQQSSTFAGHDHHEDHGPMLEVPSRASHFVDFRRLPQNQAEQFVKVQIGPASPVPPQQFQQTRLQPQPAAYNRLPFVQPQAYAAVAPVQQQQTFAPATFLYSRHHVQASMGPAALTAVGPSFTAVIPPPVVVRPTVMASALGGLVHHGVHQRYASSMEAQASGLSLVLVSRFPPPPPPSLSHMQTLLRTGCSFESFYDVVMRWYKKVSATTPKAHPQVPICPAAEHYLHDFEGWVREINLWWAKHFTRRPRGGNGGGNGNFISRAPHHHHRREMHQQ